MKKVLIMILLLVMNYSLQCKRKPFICGAVDVDFYSHSIFMNTKTDSLIELNSKSYVFDLVQYNDSIFILTRVDSNRFQVSYVDSCFKIIKIKEINTKFKSYFIRFFYSKDRYYYYFTHEYGTDDDYHISKCLLDQDNNIVQESEDNYYFEVINNEYYAYLTTKAGGSVLNIAKLDNFEVVYQYEYTTFKDISYIQNKIHSTDYFYFNEKNSYKDTFSLLKRINLNSKTIEIIDSIFNYNDIIQIHDTVFVFTIMKSNDSLLGFNYDRYFDSKKVSYEVLINDSLKRPMTYHFYYNKWNNQIYFTYWVLDINRIKAQLSPEYSYIFKYDIKLNRIIKRMEIPPTLYPLQKYFGFY